MWLFPLNFNSMNGQAQPVNTIVRAATNIFGNIAIDFRSGDTIDGVTLAEGDKILIKNQITASQNGIYTVNTGAPPTRHLDLPVGANASGYTVFVTNGTNNENSLFICENDPDSDTVGTDDLVFTLISGGTGNGSGEVNTSSNQGSDGIGVFIQKLGVDLQFKNISTNDNLVVISDDTTNNTIDIDLADTVATTNTIQTLTSKTIVDQNSNIAAGYLFASNRTTLINIESSNAPVAGQILKATSNTTATWQNETGGAGESNTMSNQGVGGVGVFKQKTGVDFEMKNINAGNNTISVVDDTGNNEIDIAVNVGNISRNELSGTLSVANGGTGTTTLGSGNVLIGAGTSAVTSSKSAPTGDFVGTSDTQILTNKTIIDTSSNVAARTLVAADGSVLIDISGSSEPTTGQVLRASSNTTSTWQDDITASNQGTGGVGVFVQKNGTDLEFKNINISNNTINIIDDTTNNEIDIAVNVGNISRNDLSGTLTVSSGGTGATTLTSGNVLIGDGTNAVTTTKAAPTGDFVGTSDTQTLTSKTIIDSSSNLAARTLVASDGAVLIDISGSGEPTTGQILKATSNTTATWQNDTGGSAEANTGSNQGTGGVGVFIQKTGVDLEFKNINAGNNTISVVDDTGNNEIDISVNVGNISRNELTGTLSVANGGTGTTTLTSGNVLIGDGTNSVTTTKVAPSGDFVGTSDTQTLTSKTIIDSSSNVAARTLVAADGAVLIDISGSGEPTTGQILKATSNTTAIWQTDTSQNNTGSNQGTGGVGVFIQKTGVDLEFKNVNAGNNTISVIDDTGNNEIDVSVNVGNINRNELSGTLAVSSGGTGTTTLTSGNVLIGDGSNAVTTTKSAPTGDFIGTSDTQTLTNKTIVDASSNVAARTLVASDGAVLIDISGSGEPTTGQILKATSNTTATWQTDSSQDNTASNQGTGGVGVFIQKTGVDLEFKNINAGNNTISVVDDTGNNEIDISVNVGNISRNELSGTLSVANGGTGTTSLTSGNVLIGDGTNAVTTTKSAPTGDFVGTSDTQTLTSKTIVDSSSNVAARTLVASDGAVLIDISASGEPTTGQVLKATSNTTATWQTDASQDNTASNQGTGGVGVFIQKTGLDLEFKNINAGNNTISVTNDTTNNEIDISVNVGNISRNELSGTLSVANGGTGNTSLTSGNVLIGDGTNAVTTAKSAPTGDFVGTSDTQTLTNKTIVDSSSNLAARTLVAADGAVLIDISGSSEPTTGQVLRASSNTISTWQDDITASNQGTGGVGVFVQKNGTDLEFKNINATNNTISIVNDTGNNEIDLAVNVGNIDRNELTGTLSVSSGGTGTTSLTSGNVLIGDGTNAVTTTKSAPSGDFVGTSDTQTLTSKTIIDSSSNLAARTLVAADGAVLIDISGSSEPTTGQVLRASSNTTSTWQDDITASNQGTGGVGVFVQKNGTDLEFKNINTSNNTINVIDDTGNNEIDIAVNVGNIDRNELTGTLTVSSGGTGTTTLTSGNVLIGAGASAVTTTKSAPTGDFVGTSDTQTLTSKTIVDTSSNIAARTLVASDGAVLIDISGSGEPTTGQILKATSNTTATWQNETGGAGESNTMSNQGTGGVGVFIQKTGVDLEVKNINAGNNTISVIDDTGNNEIDISVNVGNISRNELSGTLSVANGGTGATTLSSGNVLVGAGASAVTTTKAAPTGDFVGTSDTQTLTSKTIVDTSSNVAARTLVAADGAILIDISGSSEPTTGQVLVASSNTTATWQTDTSQDNTASNQGTGGVGVFIQKTGVDLEFKNINAGNNTISVIDDTGNNEIDIAVNVGNISRNELTGTLSVANGGTGAVTHGSGNVLIGAGTSAVTSTKAAPTGDFVGTTDTQTLTSKTIVDTSSNVAARTLVAADGAVLIDISGSSEPTTGQILKATSNTTATWQSDTGEANTGSNQGTGGVGVFIQKTGVDLEFKNINASNNTINIIDDTGNNEIDIAVNVGNLDHGELSGLLDDDHTIYALLAGRSGGQTLIGGTGSGDNLELNSTSNATKGSVLISETTDSSNTTIGALVVSGGAGIQGNVHTGGYISSDNGYFMGVHTSGGLSLNSGFTDITWELEKRKDSIYTHNTSTEAVQINITGDYKIIVDLSTDVTSGGGRSISEGRVMRDSGIGYSELTGTRTYMYNRTSTGGENSGSIHFIESLTSGDFIKVQAQRLSGSSTVSTIANGCRLLIERI